MKSIATLIFVLFIGVAAQAQTTVEIVSENTELSIINETPEKEIKIEDNTEVARLYRRSNSRVKKALSFTTKRNKAKRA